MIAWLPDGAVLAVLGDGSVKQVSPTQLEEYHQRMAQPAGLTNLSSSNRSGTNRNALDK